MATQSRHENAIVVGKTTLVAEPGGQNIVITRPFSVSRERLFRAFTDPALIAQWCGGPGIPNTQVDHMEVRSGGAWRWRFIDPQGGAVGLFGVYHDVQPPERLVYTFEYEGVPGHVLLRTVTFEDLGGSTLLTEQSVFQSVENRDGMMRSGIREGTVASWDRLEALVSEG